LTLNDEPVHLNASTSARKSSGSSAGSIRRRKVRFGSAFEITIGARYSSPFASATPRATPFRTRIARTSAPVRMCAPCARAALAIAPGDGTHPAARETPQAADPADAAHLVVEQHVGGAWRARPAVRADHAVRGERDLELGRLEPAIQEVGHALGQHAHQRDAVLRPERGTASHYLQQR